MKRISNVIVRIVLVFIADQIIYKYSRIKTLNIFFLLFCADLSLIFINMPDNVKVMLMFAFYPVVILSLFRMILNSIIVHKNHNT